MDTSAIRYRVADFLKQHPPFHLVEEADLLTLAGHGVVRFYEANQYILSQGASRYQIYVIQQGTVSLWNEGSAEPRLLDVREAGDMLGIDQLLESRVYPYSAISRGDVLVYAFPTQEIWPLVEHYPGVADHIAAYGSLTARGRQPRPDMDPHAVALRELIESRPPSCDSQTSVLDVARHLLSSGQDAIAIVDQRERVCGIATVASLAQWVATGDGNREQPIGSLIKDPPAILAPEASVVDGVLAMDGAKSNALVITSDGTLAGSLQGLLTSRNFRAIFGDRPGEILDEIRHAAHTRDLRDLNRRSRNFTLRYLNKPSSVDWLTRFTSAVDSSIVERVIAISDPESIEGCWCLCGTSGRREALPSLVPKALLVANDDRSAGVFHQVLEGIKECGYLARSDGDFEPRFYVATVEEWKDRYLGWVKDPILKKIYLAHEFFDLRPVIGSESLWNSLEATVVSAVNHDFLHLVANDCLSTLPPLTFFHNAILDESGEETTVFRLEETALRPLVDVGRVFGLATGKVFRSSTFERFAMAQNSWPEYASIFREASEALRIVLWQQGRFGITQATSGADLPPAVLGPYERQIMKSAFRAILRLIEFTGNLEWLKAL